MTIQTSCECRVLDSTRRPNSGAQNRSHCDWQFGSIKFQGHRDTSSSTSTSESCQATPSWQPHDSAMPIVLPMTVPHPGFNGRPRKRQGPRQQDVPCLSEGASQHERNDRDSMLPKPLVAWDGKCQFELPMPSKKVKARSALQYRNAARFTCSSCFALLELLTTENAAFLRWGRLLLGRELN